MRSWCPQTRTLIFIPGGARHSDWLKCTNKNSIQTQGDPWLDRWLPETPTNFFLPAWTNGGPTAVDVTVVFPMQRALVRLFAATAGHALKHSLARKLRRHDQDCHRERISFLPLAVETLGGWGHVLHWKAGRGPDEPLESAPFHHGEPRFPETGHSPLKKQCCHVALPVTCPVALCGLSAVILVQEHWIQGYSVCICMYTVQCCCLLLFVNSPCHFRLCSSCLVQLCSIQRMIEQMFIKVIKNEKK